MTGSTSGIGRSIAEQIAMSGCDVALNGFGDQEQIERQSRELEERSGSRVIHVDADLRYPEQIHSAVAQVSEQLGDVDILVNNAGIQHVAPTHEFPTQNWDEIIALNLSAVFHATKAVLPGMIERNWGRIVNIASVHGLVASINKPAYIAAKHGVVGLTKVVALETAKHAITCNAICPAWVKTELVDKQIRNLMQENQISEDEVINKMIADRQPIGRFIGTDEVAALALYLCSDFAEAITGTAIPIDGAWTAQ